MYITALPVRTFEQRSEIQSVNPVANFGHARPVHRVPAYRCVQSNCRLCAEEQRVKPSFDRVNMPGQRIVVAVTIKALFEPISIQHSCRESVVLTEQMYVVIRLL